MSSRVKFLLAVAAAAWSLGTVAQEVTLKVHHFWPPGAMPPTKILQQWCDRLASESRNRLRSESGISESSAIVFPRQRTQSAGGETRAPRHASQRV